MSKWLLATDGLVVIVYRVYARPLTVFRDNAD